MIHAYSESYLNDAKRGLAVFFDYLVNDCEMEADWTVDLFMHSGYAEQFERGNPAVISGMSGIELARAVVKKTYQNKQLPEPRQFDRFSPEYWAGWALAEYQWYSGKRFQDIFDRIALKGIILMYPVYHEMDIMKFIEAMEEVCSRERAESRLKNLRESRGLSQSELAKISGVGLRSIQMYEQRVNDIDKAQAQTVYKLSRAIGCNVEDLLEDPMTK